MRLALLRPDDTIVTPACSVIGRVASQIGLPNSAPRTDYVLFLRPRIGLEQAQLIRIKASLPAPPHD